MTNHSDHLHLVRALGWLLLALVLGVLSLAAEGQEPTGQNKPSRIDWTLLIADATARGLDTWSTHRILECHCNQEQVIPGFIANHTPTMALFSTGMVAVDWWTLRRVERKHPRLARVLSAVDIAGTATVAGHNLSLHVPPSSTLKRVGK